MARLIDAHAEDMRQLAADLELERTLRTAAVDAEARLRERLAELALAARGATAEERAAAADTLAPEAEQARAAEQLRLERAPRRPRCSRWIWR